MRSTDAFIARRDRPEIRSLDPLRVLVHPVLVEDCFGDAPRAVLAERDLGVDHVGARVGNRKPQSLLIRGEVHAVYYELHRQDKP